MESDSGTVAAAKQPAAVGDNPYLALLEEEKEEVHNKSVNNPYLKLLEDAANQQQIHFRASTALSVDANPDEIARQNRIAERLGRPLAAVQALPEDAERDAKIATIEQDTANSPALRRAFTDADFAKLAHDNSGSLSQIEGVLRAMGRGAKAGLYDIVSSGAGLMEVGYKQQAAGIDDPFTKNILLALAGKSEEWRKDWAASAEEAAGNQSDLGTIGLGMASGARSLTQMTPGLIASILTGNPALALGAAAISAGVPAATKALDAGKTPTEALLYGGTDALIEVATEMIPVARLLKDLKVGAPLYKLIARQLATEVPGELAATTLQSLNEWATLHPDKPFSAYLSELPEALAQTVVATVTMSALTGGLGAGVNAVAKRAQKKQNDAERAIQSAEELASLNELAAEDKVLKRDPQTFENFIAQATEDGPVQQVFIDANTLMQSGVAEQISSLSPSVAAQLELALQSGGQIAIPIAEYATRIAPTEFAQTLLPHLKTDPEGFSHSEAQVYMQSHAETLKTETEKALAEQQGVDAHTQSAEVVRATIKAQLDATARFSEPVNATYSSLVASFYAVQAGKIGLTPEELFQRYPVTIAAEDIVDGTRLDQEDGAASTTSDTASLIAEDDIARLDDTAPAIVPQKLDEFQQDAKPPRGSFSPANLAISLLKNADFSTFLHETGHLFLHMQFDMAAQLQQVTEPTPSESQILEDANVVLDWFGVKSLQEWNQLDFEQQRKHHEQFARGFEAYLFEGKAPSLKLQGIFQRFRAWLLHIYKDISALNVELTPAVRGVFDRMLATSEQIALAEQGRGMMPLFTSPEQARMAPEEFAAYTALNEDATNAAIEEVQAPAVRDISHVHAARGRHINRLKKETQALRDDVQGGVAEEVMSQPLYRAWQFLTSDLETVDAGRLDINALKEMDLPKEVVALLAKRKMTATDGMHPDYVAEKHRFTSGDELVRKLAEAQPPTAAINSLTDQRMLEEFGEVATPEAIERAADKAIHNGIRARLLATEANVLAKAANQRRVLASAVKEHADGIIARLKIRDIRPSQYANAEVRAAKAAESANAAGNLVAAATAKRNQLIQHYATRAAYAAQDEVAKGLAYLKKFEGANKTLDAGYEDQIHRLLERFDLRQSQTLKAVDRRTVLAEWLTAQRKAGFEPQIAQKLDNEAFRTNYKNLSVEEFRGLVDAVKQIEHLGRLKHRLLKASDQRTYEEVRDGTAASNREHSQGRTAHSRAPIDDRGRKRQALKRFRYAHIKVATWARIMDGGKDGGPMWNYIVRPANKCADMETTMRAEATAKLTEILAPVFKGGKMEGNAKFFASINRSLTRQERFAIALNMGNASNIQRMLGGEGWTMEQLTPVLQSLTAQEWQAVQGVWDHFESYWPLIEAKEKRIYGIAPPKVPLQPFNVALTDGTVVQLRGGYYPVKYDPAASRHAEQHADAESAKRQLQGAYTTATTRRAFTKERAESVTGRPLLYTLSGVYSGITDIIHDLAWHEWLIDTNRLLSSHAIDSSIREHYGPEVIQQFKSWVQDIAEGDRGATSAMEELVSRLRRNVSVSALGLNLVSAIMQPLGITQSMSRIGTRWVGRGLKRYLAHPIELTSEVIAKSEFMLNRARTRFRELNELQNQVQGQTTLAQWWGRYAYFPMMKCQQMVDVPTWWGAYEKATANGSDEATAVALADQAVIDSQGGGQIKDLAAIERGGWTKIFTVFCSFTNTTLNLGYGHIKVADTHAKKAKLLVEAIRLVTLPAMLPYFLKAVLSGDDEAWEDLPQKLAANQAEYLMGMVAGVRELQGLSGLFLDTRVRPYTGPTGLRAINDFLKLANQAERLEFDEAFWKAAINVLGAWYGLPSVQINRTITGAIALSEGETKNPAAILFGHKKKS